MKRALITPGYLPATVLVIGLFFFWGVSNSLNDILIPQFRKTFLLDDFTSGLVQSATYIGYFVFAMPAALFMRRFGYRAAVVLGLVLFGTGALLFYPAARLGAYPAFLAALFVIASGLAFLETSANPMIAVMGPAETADQRLNFAQAFNPLGTITGASVGGLLILSDASYTPAQMQAMAPEALAAWRTAELAAVKLPYVAIALLVLAWAVAVACTRFPPLDGPAGATPAPGAGGFRGLARFPRYWLGVLAQFAYVGAQVGIWSYLIRYTQHNFPGTTEKGALHWVPISFAVFFAGRFIGSLLMSRVRAETLLAVFAGVNVLLCLVAATTGGMTGLSALIASSFFMSIMFPTIFSMSLRGLGEHTKSGASFLVMAIVGGAVFTAIMGRISVASSINVAYVVPALCFLVVLMFALSAVRAPMRAADTA